jgi:putative membrane protein
MATTVAPAKTSNDLAQERTDLAGNRTELADKRTDLALERTRLAHERTLMAWVRTATSLISFGFTIHKAFQFLQQSDGTNHGLSPRGFALAMISLGIGSLTLATFQHRHDLRVLEVQYGKLPHSTAQTVATVVAGLGILALVLVAMHQ